MLNTWFSQPIIDSWLFVSVLVYPSISIPTLPPPFSLALPPQYSLYPITASLLVWSGFGCRHNENWQDTLLSTALLPPSLVRPPYLPPFLHPFFQQWIHFFIMLFFFHSSIWSLSHFVLLQFFPSLVSFHFVFAPQHAPVSRWLINPNCLAVSSPCYMLNSSTLYCVCVAAKPMCFHLSAFWKLVATLFLEQEYKRRLAR